MMRTRSTLLLALAIAGCGKGQDRDRAATAPASFDVAKADLASESPGAAEPSTTIKVVLPQIAYTYAYQFRLPESAIAKVEQAHVALCDRLGVARCHVASMTQTAGEHGVSNGTLILRIDATQARAFGAALKGTAAHAGGEAVTQSIEAEDLSKQIIDTDARIRAKQLLADRLATVLQTHKGSIADLVAAERALSDVVQEIDAAKSEVADARGRVAMSTIRIDYAAEVAMGTRAAGPVADAWSQIGRNFGESLAMLILLFSGLAPWLVVLGLVGLIVRALVKRRQRREEASEILTDSAKG